ncbi:MAG: phage tail protein, partial [Paracoccaceae bacterium]
DGVLAFRMRDGRPDHVVGQGSLATTDDLSGFVETMRAMEAEVVGRVRLSFIEAEGDYEARAVEAIFPDEETATVSQSEVNLSLTQPEARRMVERWLSEARVARDGAKFALPPSLGHIGPGDVVRLADGPNGAYRIDRVERAGAVAVEAIRVEPAIYQPSDEAEARVTPRAFIPPVPVEFSFLDLPLMSGNEVEHQPHIAITANPWPGAVAVYSSDVDAGYRLNRQINSRAIIGETLSTLDPARHGIWDRGRALRVRITGGALSSVTDDQTLNGANILAIGDGSAANWELLQFRDAVLVAPDTYDLSMRLRGQAGTDTAISGAWPAGSRVVLMNGAPKQLAISISERDLLRHYRIGAAKRPYTDPSFVHVTEAFAGIGLRPLSPCHLRARRLGAGDYAVGWIRRTRIDGDSWSAYEVPLGELRERYLLRVTLGGTIVREMTLGSPDWIYSIAMRAADGTAGQTFRLLVAQLSDAFGPGPFTEITIND